MSVNNVLVLKIREVVIDGAVFTQVKSAGYGVVYSGPGGKQVSKRLTPNVQAAVSNTVHHFWWEMGVELDADVSAAVYGKNLHAGAKTFTLQIVEEGKQNGVLKVRTWTFNNTVIDSIERFTVKDPVDVEHQVCAIEFSTLTEPAIPGWNNA